MDIVPMLAVGGEQATTHSATSDTHTSNVQSFAQSFGESVDHLARELPMSDAKDVFSELKEGKIVDGSVDSERISTSWKCGGDATEGSNKNTPAKTDLILHQGISSRERPKEIAPEISKLHDDGKNIALPIPEPQEKTYETVLANGNDEKALDAKDTMDKLSLEPKYSPPIDGMSVKVNRPVLSSGSSEVSVHKKPISGEKTQEIAATKKSEKSSGGDGVSPGMLENPAGIIDKTTTAITGGGAIPLLNQMSALSDARGSVANDLDSANTARGKDVELGPIAARKDIPGRSAAQTIKNKAEVAEQATNTTSTKDFVEEISKATTVDKIEGEGGDKQAVAIMASAPSHAMVLVNGAVSNTAEGMIAGHASLEAGGGKIHAGEIGSHATEVQPGSGDQLSPSAAADEAGMSHRTLLATPTTLEVGLANGAQGWLKIRAEVTDGGAVNASLSTSNSAGQEMLHRELPALTAYLHDERVAINDVVVHNTTVSESRSGADTVGGGRDHAQQSHRQGSRDDRQRDMASEATTLEDGLRHLDLNGGGEDGMLPTGVYGGGGGWLNVRA